MITVNGLNAINQFLVRGSAEWAGTITVGLLNTTATSSTTQYLQYEFIRVPVILKSLRSVTVSGSAQTQIALKATLDPSLAFQAYEIGVYPARMDGTANIDIFPVSDFSEFGSGSSLWSVVGGAAAPVVQSNPTPRAGAYAMVLAAGQTASVAANFSTAGYYASDFVDVLYFTGASVASGSITVTFGDNSTTTVPWAASAVVTNTAASGFNTARLAFTTKPTNFSDYLSSVSVTYQGTGSAVFDHMRFYTGGNKPVDYQLVARNTASSTTTPLITKNAGQSMDLEFYIPVAV